MNITKYIVSKFWEYVKLFSAAINTHILLRTIIIKTIKMYCNKKYKFISDVYF